MKARLVLKANRALDLERQGRRLFIRGRKIKLCRGLDISRDALQLVFAFRIDVSVRARKIAINSVLFNERRDFCNGSLLRVRVNLCAVRAKLPDEMIVN